MFSVLLTLSGAGLVWVRGVEAQNSNATCLSTYSWMTNSRGQNPCLVAAYVQGACTTDGQWTVRSIPDSSTYYLGPEVDQATVCTCSSVSFSLISACSTCQGASVSTWIRWTGNCPISLISNGSYPHSIPPGTAVPAWAYQVINSTGLWDPVSAQEVAAAGFPESTAIGQQTTISQTSSSTSSLPITSSSSTTSTTPTSTPTPSEKKDIGPIVGGAVGGGIGGLILLSAAIFFCWRYWWKRPPPPASDATVVGPGDYGTYLGTPSPKPMQPSSPAMKLYNPDDPSTFPTLPSHSPPPVSPQDYNPPGAPFMTPQRNYSGDLVPNRASYA